MEIIARQDELTVEQCRRIAAVAGVECKFVFQPTLVNDKHVGVLQFVDVNETEESVVEPKKADYTDKKYLEVLDKFDEVCKEYDELSAKVKSMDAEANREEYVEATNRLQKVSDLREELGGIIMDRECL